MYIYISNVQLETDIKINVLKIWNSNKVQLV